MLECIIALPEGAHMPTLDKVLRNLRAERARAQAALERIDGAISALTDGRRGPGRPRAAAAGEQPAAGERPRRKLSPAAKARIAAAQKARWARFRQEKGAAAGQATAKEKPRKKRRVSAETLAKMRAAQKARWARAKGGKE
jgi:hypothetical protein